MEAWYITLPLLVLTAGFGASFVISLNKKNDTATGLLLMATMFSFFGATHALDTTPDRAALCAEQGGVLIETLTPGYACLSSEFIITELARDPDSLEVH